MANWRMPERVQGAVTTTKSEPVVARDVEKRS